MESYIRNILTDKLKKAIYKMIVLIILYVFLSLLALILPFKFRKYIASDYLYNKSLNRKRRWSLFFMYFMMLVQAFVFIEFKGSEYPDIPYKPIALAAFILGVTYALSLLILETPKRYKKRK